MLYCNHCNRNTSSRFYCVHVPSIWNMYEKLRGNRSCSFNDQICSGCLITLRRRLDLVSNDGARVSMDPVPQAFHHQNQFTDLKQIGEGTFGRVYSAFVPSANLRCALKVQVSTAIGLKTESELINQMNFLYIVTLFGSFDSGPNNVMVMELGMGDLEDYMGLTEANSTFRKTATRNIRFLHQLLLSVHYFQETTNHIHMDIKPANVLVSAADCIKLTDFGSAISFMDKREVLTQPIAITEAYSPPELLRRPFEFDTTVDVWALGCIGFQLLMDGEHPFFPGDDINLAMDLMSQFEQGQCNIEGYASMESAMKDFCQATIGMERRKRPLISELLHIPLFSNLIN